MSDKPEQAEIVRDAKELQRAHDLSVNIIVNEKMQEDVLGEAKDRQETIRCMKAAADVLCWALGHDHNVNFEYNLIHLEMMVRAAGYEMQDAGRLVWLEEGDGTLPS